MNAIHPKVAATTLTAAVATLVAAATHGTGNAATIGAAALTVAQFAIGYLTPAKRTRPAKPPKPAHGHWTWSRGKWRLIGWAGGRWRHVGAGTNWWWNGTRWTDRPEQPFTMLDTVTPNAIKGVASTSFEAVAGYDDGLYNDIAELEREYPHDRHLSICVRASDDGDCLDVERGDATPDQVPGWCTRQHARGVKRPCVYASLSTWPAILAALRSAGVDPRLIRKWAADWTWQPHIPSGFDACQWTNRYQGRNIDASLCVPGFFD